MTERDERLAKIKDKLKALEEASGERDYYATEIDLLRWVVTEIEGGPALAWLEGYAAGRSGGVEPDANPYPVYDDDGNRVCASCHTPLDEAATATGGLCLNCWTDAAETGQ